MLLNRVIRFSCEILTLQFVLLIFTFHFVEGQYVPPPTEIFQFSNIIIIQIWFLVETNSIVIEK